VVAVSEKDLKILCRINTDKLLQSYGRFVALYTCLCLYHAEVLLLISEKGTILDTIQKQKYS